MGDRFVIIRTSTWERLRDLQRVYDLDLVRTTARRTETGAFEIQGLLTDEDVEQLRSDGYEVTVTADAEAIARERAKEIGQTDSP